MKNRDTHFRNRQVYKHFPSTFREFTLDLSPSQEFQSNPTIHLVLEPKCLSRLLFPRPDGPEAEEGKWGGKRREGSGQDGTGLSWVWIGAVLTSRCPLCTAWCRALRPLLSATLRLLNRGARASAHFVARLAAATCSGVCHSLSRAFTSAECASSSPSTFCKGAGIGEKREGK